MDKDSKIKPWVRNIIAFAIPFDEEGNYRFESRDDGLVTLTKQTWEEHILPNHSEVDMNWSHIEKTLQDPSNIQQAGDVKIYSKEFAERVAWDDMTVPNPEKFKYFMVVIQISNKFIKTIKEKPEIEPIY
jgi:hypothetical protein